MVICISPEDYRFDSFYSEAINAWLAGAAEFITKPIMADALLGVVQKYIQDNP